MVKARVKKGVWTKISYSEGDNLNKLSTDFQSRVNEYRDDPTPETEKAMDDANAAFKKAWKAIK